MNIEFSSRQDILVNDKTINVARYDGWFGLLMYAIGKAISIEDNGKTFYLNKRSIVIRARIAAGGGQGDKKHIDFMQKQLFADTYNFTVQSLIRHLSNIWDYDFDSIPMVSLDEFLAKGDRIGGYDDDIQLTPVPIDTVAQEKNEELQRERKKYQELDKTNRANRTILIENIEKLDVKIHEKLQKDKKRLEEFTEIVEWEFENKSIVSVERLHNCLGDTVFFKKAADLRKQLQLTNDINAAIRKGDHNTVDRLSDKMEKLKKLKSSKNENQARRKTLSIEIDKHNEVIVEILSLDKTDAGNKRLGEFKAIIENELNTGVKTEKSVLEKCLGNTKQCKHAVNLRSELHRADEINAFFVLKSRGELNNDVLNNAVISRQTVLDSVRQQAAEKMASIRKKKEEFSSILEENKRALEQEIAGFKRLIEVLNEGAVQTLDEVAHKAKESVPSLKGIASGAKNMARDIADAANNRLIAQKGLLVAQTKLEKLEKEFAEQYGKLEAMEVSLSKGAERQIALLEQEIHTLCKLMDE